MPNIKQQYRFVSSFLMLATLAAFGCSPESKIETKRIHKTQSGYASLRSDTNPKATQVTQPTRMVVAIFEQGDLMWFFKVSGPAEQVDAAQTQWQKFLDDIEFRDGQPKWQIPDGWSDAGAKPMRHATLIVGDTQPPLEFVISNLSTGQDMLLNLNRWRRQINLPPATEGDVKTQLIPAHTKAGDYLLFDQTGTGSGTMRPPFAGQGAQPTTDRQPNTATPPAEITFVTPDGWTKGESSRMIPVLLSLSKDNAQAQITIVKMPADKNKWTPNVNRWVKQVGLEHLSDAELEKRTSTISVGGIEGKLINLSDPEFKSETTLIAGMVKKNGSAWFIKIYGDKQMVEDGRKAFDGFIESIQFK